MRTFITFIVLISSFVTAYSQIEYFNSDDYWHKLVLDKASDPGPIADEDTTIIVATNRKMDTANLRFMEAHREESKIRYFIVHTSRGKWQVKQAKDLYSALRLVPNQDKDWVVYTEGMGKLFTSELDRGITLAGQYGVNVLMLDYPSISPTHKRLGNYYFAIKNARRTYRYFGPVLDTLKKIKADNGLGKGHLTLFFHSMGNNLMKGIVKHHRLKPLNNTVWVDNIILNAPCVVQRRHRKWVEQIHFSKQIYIHYNPHDYTLSGAHFLSLKKQLGEKVRKPLAKNAVYINFFGVAGRGHSNFLSINGRQAISEACMRHYRAQFHGDSLQLHNPEWYIPSDYRGIGWNILP